MPAESIRNIVIPEGEWDKEDVSQVLIDGLPVTLGPSVADFIYMDMTTEEGEKPEEESFLKVLGRMLEEGTGVIQNGRLVLTPEASVIVFASDTDS